MNDQDLILIPKEVVVMISTMDKETPACIDNL